MVRRIAIVSLVSALGVSIATVGKCPYQDYVFRGVIRDAGDSKAVPGAQVGILLDGRESAYPAKPVESDEHGGFAATSWFDTFVSYSPLAGHRCDAKPSRVEVVISRDGYAESRVQFPISTLKSHTQGDTQEFELPPIDLKRASGKAG